RRWHAPLNLKIGIGGLWAGSEHTEIANTPSAAEGGGAVAGPPPIGVVRRPFKEPPLTAESGGATRAALLAMRAHCGTGRRYVASDEEMATSSLHLPMECRDAPAKRPRPAPGQALSRPLVALDQNSTIIAVIEMIQSSWLVAGMLPGIERQPRKKLEPSAERLLGLLHRWRDEAVGAGRTITRIAVAFEAGRDGFWLARWLAARGVEAHVIHASSLAVSREHRRAKTDRLDTELLKRGFLGWLRGERGHCSMA